MELVDGALRLTAGSVGYLAEEVGASRESLHAWASGKRSPGPAYLAKLVQAMRRRGGELARLADELEAVE